MAESPAYPVRAFGEHARALEAAMSVCLGDPSRKPVHEVRSACNRVDAVLELLEAQQGLPPHKLEAQAVRRQLKRLRHAAGIVRDFDVQRKLLKKNFLQQPPEQHPHEAVVKGCQELRRICKRGRKKAIRKLLRILRKHQGAVSSALQSLSEVLASAEALTVPVRTLLKTLDGELRSREALEPNQMSPASLHEFRKVAKRGRYKAELGSASPRAAQRAETLKQLQDLGGDWHDWFQLTELARSELGRKKPATLEFARREAAFRQRFCDLAQT